MLEAHTRTSSLASNSPYYHTTIQSPGGSKARRPSLSNAMSWLTHTKGSASTSSLASPTSSKHHHPLPQISEPTLTNLDASVPSPRLGALGSGATVVRTPAEALSLAAQRQKQFENIRRPVGALEVNAAKAGAYPAELLRETEEEMSPRSPVSAPSLLNPSAASIMAKEDIGPTPRNSSIGSTHGSASGSANSSRERMHIIQPSVPGSPLSSSLKMRNSGSQYHASYMHNPHPSLVSAITSAPAQPPFSALLLSHLPQNMYKIDPSRVLVMVESSEGSQKCQKTTLATVLARGEGSHLAGYLTSVIAETAVPDQPMIDTKQTVPGTPSTDDEADKSSLTSQRSEFHDSDVDEEDMNAFDAIFQNQLGLAPSTGSAPGLSASTKPKRRADATQVVHVFLDRPSAPYAHIFAYLRSGMLPYAARLPHASSPLFCSRLEGLLELRDEAVYLGLEELLKLCSDDLSGASLGGDRLSTHTLIDPAEADKARAHAHSHMHLHSNANLHAHNHGFQHPHARTHSNAKPPPTGPLPHPPEPLVSPGLAGFQFPQHGQGQIDAQVQAAAPVPPHVIPPTVGRERQGSDGSLPAPVRNGLHMRSKSRDPYGPSRTTAVPTHATPKPTENYF